MSRDVIDKLRYQLDIPIEVMEDTNYKTDKKPVKMEYQDDVDIPEFQQLPTYKRICVCILKNDFLCKFAGFSLTKGENELRKNAELKYENIQGGH